MRISDWCSDVCSSDLCLDTSTWSGDGLYFFIFPFCFYEGNQSRRDWYGAHSPNPLAFVSTPGCEQGQATCATSGGESAGARGRWHFGCWSRNDDPSARLASGAPRIGYELWRVDRDIHWWTGRGGRRGLLSGHMGMAAG